MVRLVIVQSQWCNYRVISLPADYVLDIWPEYDYPHGREALELSRVWRDHLQREPAGLLLLGCDIAADPDDLEAMHDAVVQAPEDVHTGMVKLWPQSTGRPGWMWSHRGGTIEQPAATQDENAPVTYFSLGFLWAPARLLDLAFPRGQVWRWGETDVELSKIAWVHGIAAHAVPGCRPKHLHFQGEHDGEHIRQRANPV